MIINNYFQVSPIFNYIKFKLTFVILTKVLLTYEIQNLNNTNIYKRVTIYERTNYLNIKTKKLIS